MGSDRCIHEIPRATCAYCMPRRRYDWKAIDRHFAGEPGGAVRGPVAYDWLSLDEAADRGGLGEGPAFDADKHGTCPGCGGHVKPGDPIHWDGELDGYACGGCSRYGAGAVVPSDHSY